ncbi:hypothetical protein TSUD_214180 [Trifolium subterraneum]|uniref:Uncharacterized protein n=1 Tax=Trifolium subterraneum TaxID=3900 RepID=A0A2Z6N5I7_TRISU|nr:hypothetical protein TSUD_214180 [Trifolium subterraneum]
MRMLLLLGGMFAAGKRKDGESVTNDEKCEAEKARELQQDPTCASWRWQGCAVVTEYRSFKLDESGGRQ